MAVKFTESDDGRTCISLSGADAVKFWRILTDDADPPPALVDAVKRYKQNLTDTESDPRLTPPGESVSVRALKARDYAG